MNATSIRRVALLLARSMVGALVVAVVTGNASAQDAGQRPVDGVNLGKGSAPDTTTKIVGGSPADPGRYPFQVALIAARTPPDSEALGQFCGGSLVARRWVLTAAHCVPMTRPEEIDTYAGSAVLPAGGTVAASGKQPRGERHHVAQVISHPGYDSVTHDNDVALLKLVDPVSERLAPVILATAGLERERGSRGASATVIGWGATSEGGRTSPVLVEVGVIVQDRGLCESNYRAVVPAARVTGNMLCAGVPEGGKDSCQGDSGGFLGVPLAEGKFAQLGVVSWGAGCARPKLFGVYARVSQHEAWLRQTMKDFE